MTAFGQNPKPVTYQDRVRNARLLMVGVRAPLTRANFTRLAVKYEREYRACRKRGNVAQRHLLGMALEARAFYCLARQAEA